MRRKRRKRSIEYTPQKKKRKTKMTKDHEKDVKTKSLQAGATVTTRAKASAMASLPSSENANSSVQTADAMTTVDASEPASLSSPEDCNTSGIAANAAIAIGVSESDLVSSSENMTLSPHAANLQTGAEVMTEAEASKTALVPASEKKKSDPQTENLPADEAELEVETPETEDSLSNKVVSVLQAALIGIGAFLMFLTILVMIDNALDLLEHTYCYNTGFTGWLNRFSTLGSPMCASIQDIKVSIRSVYTRSWMCGASGAGIWLVQNCGRKFWRSATPTNEPPLGVTIRHG